MLLFDFTGIGNGAIGVVVTILSIMAFVLGSSDFKEAIVRRLTRSIKGMELITFDDLPNHDVFIKLNYYATARQYKFIDSFNNTAKQDLFCAYVNILCSVQRASLLKILDRAILGYTDQQLKAFLMTEQESCSVEFDKRLKDLLISKNGSDLKKVNTVVDKVAGWRQAYIDVLLDNALSVASSGNDGISSYKLYTILAIYNTGFNYIILRGADSFQQLNGELDAFLKTS